VVGHWYVMIPGILVLLGLGMAINRAKYQRYRRRLEAGLIKPKPPKRSGKPLCFDHHPIQMAQGTLRCPNCHEY
jgi:hypothetical protein